MTLDRRRTKIKTAWNTLSIQSTLSTTSGCSIKQNSRNLREKLNEIRTYRDILNEQISTIQCYFDSCSSSEETQTPVSNHGLRPIDFKGEALTFRETSSALLVGISNCLDQIIQKEDHLKKILEKESENRKKLESELR